MPKISRRVGLVSLLGAVALAGITIALASTNASPSSSEPTVEDASAHFVAPSNGIDGAFTFTANTADDSGVRHLKVLAWPEAGKKPTARDLAHADRARCKKIGQEKARCTYTLRVNEQEADGLTRGRWIISTLLTGRDGDTRFVPRAATVTLDF
ncbi:DUF5707 domain-containing protein [Streptomyces sp. NPDC048172]|uniref:DUF5707 domain-containing protein n=1 Tax=Streptomyces sp. NPDC048172 TaxID=3365505 RepID=UPI00371AA2E1